MGTLPTEQESIRYPQEWAPMEFDCKECGVRFRYGVEYAAGAGQWHKHCPKDEERLVPGKVFAVWELRNGDWVLSKT